MPAQNVVPFPPRPLAMLQPSVHGRGARPFQFLGRIDPWHAPGIHRSGRGWASAVDAAWVVESVLQTPPVAAPARWPGVPVVRDTARAMGAEKGLFDYQQEGAAFLAERDYAILSDAMGGGKTAQSLVGAEARLTQAAIQDPEAPLVLIVCPALAKRHWQREVEKWTGAQATVLEGLRPYGGIVGEAMAAAFEKPRAVGTPVEFSPGAVERFLGVLHQMFPRLTYDISTFDEKISADALEKRLAHWLQRSGYTGSSVPLPQTRYIIANYDILYTARRRNAKGVLQDKVELPGWGETLRGRFLLAILDEGHILRGRKSRKSSAVKSMLVGVPVVWILTGTPMPNYVRDLWGLIDVCSDGLHGTYWNWVKKYCAGYEGEYGWVDTGASDLDELGRRLTFFMLGRSKEQMALELPPKRREVYEVDVQVSAPTVGDAHKALQKHRVVANALRATAKAKRPLVVEQAVDALNAGQKVVVATYLRDQAEKIAGAVKKVSDRPVISVHGDMLPADRDVAAQAFRETDGAALFVATMDSVGVAISLVGAELVLFADLSHEPWKMLQFEGRTHRIGGEVAVLVRYLIAKGTIDEAIAESVLTKLANIEQTLGKDEDGHGLTGLLQPDPSIEEKIIDGLFAKLKAWAK